VIDPGAQTPSGLATHFIGKGDPATRLYSIPLFTLVKTPWPSVIDPVTIGSYALYRCKRHTGLNSNTLFRKSPSNQ